MSTRSVIAIPTPEGWEGRYVHYDGYPTGVGENVRKIVVRDGLVIARENLVRAHTDWLEINHQQGPPPPTQVGNGLTVLGYGRAGDEFDWWISSTDDDSAGTQWAYVLGEHGIDVHTRALGWQLLGTVAYDDPEGMAQLQARINGRAVR